MTDKTFILDLAKLTIAAAWADGELAADEINALKDLLFTLGDVSAEDWSVLEMYMESPPSEEERKELVDRVLGSIRSSEEKELVIRTLENLFQSDGKVTREEKALLDELRQEISGVDTGIFSGFTRAFKSVISKRQDAVGSSSLREADAEDYTNNTIYYDLVQKQKADKVSVNKPEEDLRKICLAAGLLAHVTNTDHHISDAEEKEIRSIISRDWDLSAQDAELLFSLSLDRVRNGLDYFRLSHNYFAVTTHEERREFIKTLFRVANASEKTDNQEIEEIRRVSQSLKLSHKDFIDAKLTIPRQDRNGL